MSNPYLPNWEYIPDGEPRVFGDRVYIYGSHDRPGSDSFCDCKLKVWSAPVSDPGNWVCHGNIFLTRPDRDRAADVDWSDDMLFAPDVVEKDGKYYLYAYIVNAHGCVAVADRPEGPFQLLSKYAFQDTPENDRITTHGWFIDPGVLVDDDGKVYIYCGFERSFMAQINPDNMYEIYPDSISEHFIAPVNPDDPSSFFEAASPRKIGNTYYMIYSPQQGSRLAYATSSSPIGPWKYRGYIVDNSVEYPGGNNHGSICKIGDQWYIFYHRMTNGTIMSRRGCVEKIEILPDGSIPYVEMTSLGFAESLNPYEIQPAEIACVLQGGCIITEKNAFTRVITNITSKCIIGYKYFDFGEDYTSKTMRFMAETIGMGCNSTLHVYVDEVSDETEIGTCEIGLDGGVVTTYVKAITGRHAIYFMAEDTNISWTADMFKGRNLYELKNFVFMK